MKKSVWIALAVIFTISLSIFLFFQFTTKKESDENTNLQSISQNETYQIKLEEGLKWYKDDVLQFMIPYYDDCNVNPSHNKYQNIYGVTFATSVPDGKDRGNCNFSVDVYRKSTHDNVSFDTEFLEQTYCKQHDVCEIQKASYKGYNQAFEIIFSGKENARGDYGFYKNSMLIFKTDENQYYYIQCRIDLNDFETDIEKCYEIRDSFNFIS